MDASSVDGTDGHHPGRGNVLMAKEFWIRESLLNSSSSSDTTAARTRQTADLARLAREAGGFLSDNLRRDAWPIILNCPHKASGSEKRDHVLSSDAALDPTSSQNDWQALPEHRDEGQVRLDVDRSFVYYPAGLSSDHSRRLKRDLLDVITATLRRHPKLCYFQGFHDIVQVLLLVLGKERCFDAVTAVSLFRLRDFMLPSLSTSLAHLELLPSILAAVDPLLARHVAGTRPFFALGATLTLFAHEVESYTEIARLFDFLLAHEAALAIYLFASIILSRREELLEIPADEPEMLHFTLSKLPKTLDLDGLIMEAVRLIRDHPPEKLPSRAWARISRHSVLKSTRGDGPPLTLPQASDLFELQLRDMIAAERLQKTLAAMWAWRRPLGGVGIAVAVGILSIWLQRSSTSAAAPPISRLGTLFFDKLTLLMRRLLPLAYD